MHATRQMLQRLNVGALLVEKRSNRKETERKKRNTYSTYAHKEDRTMRIFESTSCKMKNKKENPMKKKTQIWIEFNRSAVSCCVSFNAMNRLKREKKGHQKKTYPLKF